MKIIVLSFFAREPTHDATRLLGKISLVETDYATTLETIRFVHNAQDNNGKNKDAFWKEFLLVLLLSCLYLLCSSHVFILVLLLNCLYFFMFSTRRKYYCSVRCAMTLMKILLPQDSAMNIANIIIHFTCRLIFMSSIFLLTHSHYLTNVKEDVECDY